MAIWEIANWSFLKNSDLNPLHSETYSVSSIGHYINGSVSGCLIKFPFNSICLDARIPLSQWLHLFVLLRVRTYIMISLCIHILVFKNAVVICADIPFIFF